MHLTKILIVTFFLFFISCFEAFCLEPIRVGDEILIKGGSLSKVKRGKPSIAYGKNTYFIAWQEGWRGDRGNSRINVARVNSYGKLMSSDSLEIAPSKTGIQENPQIAFYNGVFCVVWQDMRNGSACNILAARISHNGQIIDIEPLPTAVGQRTQAMPVIASDSRGFLIAWQGFSGKDYSSKVFIRRLNMDGSLTKPVVVTKGAAPLIAWNGENMLLVSQDVSKIGPVANRHLKIQRISRSGKILSNERKAGYNTSMNNSVCGIPGKGWALISMRATPDFWGWSGPGAQRVYALDLDGLLADDSPSENYYDHKSRKIKIPNNWLDTSLGKKIPRRPFARLPEVYPWGKSSVVFAKEYCIAVWQRYHTGGATGAELINGDIRVGRMDRWKPLDQLGGLDMAVSSDDEIEPALAGDGEGNALCVYKKITNGISNICARTISTNSVLRE